MPLDSNYKVDRPINPLADLLLEELKRRQPRSIGHANQIAIEVTGRYNQTPQRELGGMSPDQASLISRPDWMDEAITLNVRLALDDLSGATLFQNARRLLLTIRASGVVKSTATGAFNRKFATQMFEEFVISASNREMTLRYNKVLNQNDIPYLALLRHLLPQAGLLLFRKGEFRLTKRATGLLGESTAGELFALLFRTLILRINLSALDSLPEVPQVQQTIGFAFYQIHKRADSWTELAVIVPDLFLPAVLKLLPALSWSQDVPMNYVQSRILRPLKDFGLMEYDPEHLWKSPDRVRKSRLFNQFIQFHLPPSLEETYAK
jgi:hypothetical protein